MAAPSTGMGYAPGFANTCHPNRAAGATSSSYALERIAEEELGPLFHRLFIAAMLHCGHRFIRQGRHNPNAYYPGQAAGARV